MGTPSELAAALRAAGLDVKENTGWEERGWPWAEGGQPIGVMHHHTAAPVPYPIAGLNGSRPDRRVRCNMNTKPDGTVWLIAYKGTNYSSGTGSRVVLDEVRRRIAPPANALERGLSNDGIGGNSRFWNFENDHLGHGEPIPAVQLEAIVVATLVVCAHFGIDRRQVIGHAEWTPGKRDPNWAPGGLRAIEVIRARLADVNPFPIPGATMSYTEGLTEGQWRDLYRRKLAKARTVEELLDYWMAPTTATEPDPAKRWKYANPDRSPGEHASASASVLMAAINAAGAGVTPEFVDSRIASSKLTPPK